MYVTCMHLYSKILLRILDRLNYLEISQQDVPQNTFHSSKKEKRKNPFVLTSKVQNMPCETESLIVYVCFVIWCFILYRILWTHQSAVCFLLWSNVLTHIPKTVMWKLKKCWDKLFQYFGTQLCFKSRSYTDLLMSVLHLFLLPKGSFSFTVKSGTFVLEKHMSVVISLS